MYSHEILDFFEAKFQENITLNIPQLGSKIYLNQIQAQIFQKHLKLKRYSTIHV